MPRVLITNAHLREFAGSEMVTLELAEAFTELGWAVDVYAHSVATPFSTEFAALVAAGSQVSDDPQAFGGHDYDLFWVQHCTMPRPALDRFATSPKRPHLIWNHMSAFADYELPLLADIENRNAAIITFVSPEVQTVLQPFGLVPQKARLLQNPAPQAFINAPVTNRESRTLQTVAFVSNHPPQELETAAHTLEEHGITVTRIGAQRQQRIVPEVLQRSDAIVTIGKTVPYALCLGIPVYQYDHFGGCGWLHETNFSHELATNFSGRGTGRTLSGKTIAHEILDGYEHAREFARTHLDTHRAMFRLDTRLDELLAEALTRPRATLDEADRLRWAALSQTMRTMLRNAHEFLTVAKQQSERANRLETQLQLATDMPAVVRKRVHALRQKLAAGLRKT